MFCVLTVTVELKKKKRDLYIFDYDSKSIDNNME